MLGTKKALMQVQYPNADNVPLGSDNKVCISGPASSSVRPHQDIMAVIATMRLYVRDKASSQENKQHSLLRRVYSSLREQ